MRPLRGVRRGDGPPAARRDQAGVSRIELTKELTGPLVTLHARVWQVRTGDDARSYGDWMLKNDALAFNGLATSWPEIIDVGREGSGDHSAQGRVDL